jgi:hypothetical protein
MSVAIVIKNTILVILIILIGHFMVKNYLLDKHVKSSINSLTKQATVLATKPNTYVGGPLVPIKTELALAPIVPENETPIAKPSSDAMGTIQGGLDKAKEELLKFIDDDDEEDNVDRYFSKDTTLPQQPTDNCKVKVDDKMLPLSSTCDQTIQSMPRNDMVAKTNTTTHSPQKNVVFLKEYENESTMNGGELFGGLTAFDAFDNNFHSFYDV